MATEQLGWAVIELGGGRTQLQQPVDPTVGLEVLVRIGEPIARGAPWLRMFGSRARHRNERARGLLASALEIAENPPEPRPIVLDVCPPSADMEYPATA